MPRAPKKMTFLLADSGGSKTDWRLHLPNGQVIQAHTQGLNPMYTSEETLHKQLQVRLNKQLEGQPAPDFVYFYGAGCTGKDDVDKIKHALQSAFPISEIEVYDDLLGAARALCGIAPGMALILGTGSNACSFDGEQITKRHYSGGFLLGDEGSGADLGRRFVRAWLREGLPRSVAHAFEKKFGADKNTFIHDLYAQEAPAPWLGRLTRFLFDFRHEPFVYQLLKEGFKEFLNAQVLPLNPSKQLPLSATGSVAFYFQDILREAAQEEGFHFQRVVQKPIAGLLLYHQALLAAII